MMSSEYRLLDGDAPNGYEKYSLQEFKETSGHEFGHGGLSLGDVYSDEQITNKFPSIMNS